MKGSYMKTSAKITTKELEERFDKGEDVLEFFDTRKAEVEDPRTQRVNVDFPEWMVRRLDDEASRLSITRQSLIKFIINSALTSRGVHRHGSVGTATLAPFLKDLLNLQESVPSGLFSERLLQLAGSQTGLLQLAEAQAALLKLCARLEPTE